jgi:Thioesterase domain
VIMAGEIEKRFNCKFSPSQIIDVSTIALQINHIRKQGLSKVSIPSNLTICHPEGEMAPLFMLHGLRGFNLYHKSFLEGMGHDRPIIFVEARGMDGKIMPPDTVEEIAADYLSSMRQVAPEGNWLLASNCAGCLIAIEICKQAELAGESVVKLMLIDPPPGRFINPHKKHSDFGKWLDANIERQAMIEGKIQIRISGNQNSMIPSNVSYCADSMRQVLRILGQAYNNYTPSPWDGLVFVMVSLPYSRIVEHLKSYFPNVKIKLMQCDHNEIFADHLPDLTVFLKDSIESQTPV